MFFGKGRAVGFHPWLSHHFQNNQPLMKRIKKPFPKEIYYPSGKCKKTCVLLDQLPLFQFLVYHINYNFAFDSAAKLGPGVLSYT